MSKKDLYTIARKWEESTSDNRDQYGYKTLLDEILFHSELRYCQYQSRSLESFSSVLLRWIQNCRKVSDQQALLKLFESLIFVDDGQMVALYRDAFRRVISPWLAVPPASFDDMIAPDYHQKQIGMLRSFQLASVTESCRLDLLLKENSLGGVPRQIQLGPKVGHARRQLAALSAGLSGLIVCEDIVGTGNQAGRILKAVEDGVPASYRLLFVPMVAFESGVKNITDNYVKRTRVEPVVRIPEQQCLKESPVPKEPHLFKTLRGIVKTTSARVLSANDQWDEKPENPFGYEGSGGLIVTSHNAPNNTIPLIHHKAPEWMPLFQRLHHKERK